MTPRVSHTVLAAPVASALLGLSGWSGYDCVFGHWVGVSFALMAVSLVVDGALLVRRSVALQRPVRSSPACRSERVAEREYHLPRNREDVMTRRMSVLVVLCATIGCSEGGMEAVREVPPEVFAGAWRSVTPPLEFLRLTVHPESSRMSQLGARLTFSGVAWEGSGRVDGDSLVLIMTIAGDPSRIGTVVAHRTDDQTMRVQLHPASASAMTVTFVRDN